MPVSLFAPVADPREHILLIDPVVRGIGAKGIAVRILLREHAFHPNIPWESIQVMESEKGYAVCHLYANAQNPGQGFDRLFLVGIPKLFQINFTAQD